MRRLTLHSPALVVCLHVKVQVAPVCRQALLLHHEHPDIWAHEVSVRNGPSPLAWSVEHAIMAVQVTSVQLPAETVADMFMKAQAIRSALVIVMKLREGAQNAGSLSCCSSPNRT
mmetsp:Transcript_15170/g.25962  ORF Transcript_15170/g.25962 Transcript_15170/m.25962 type:complete len:115 (-) Transcript_15170:7-351(-)